MLRVELSLSAWCIPEVSCLRGQPACAGRGWGAHPWGYDWIVSSTWLRLQHKIFDLLL